MPSTIPTEVAATSCLIGVCFNVPALTSASSARERATAEKGSFSRAQMNGLIDLAEAGLKQIFDVQREVLTGSR